MDELEDQEFGDDLTMRRGPAWVLVSVPSIGMNGDMDVKVECGPVIGVEELKSLLRKTLEAL